MGHAPALALLSLAAFGAAAQDPPAREAPPARAPQGATAPERTGDALEAPPPRHPIAGLHGFASRSTIVYPALPDRPHELQVAYVFPDRVRWWFALRDARSEERRLRYRYGERVLALEPRQTASVEYRAEDRTALLQAFELRRALFLWPDGFAWAGDGDERKVTLGELGVLRARLGAGPDRLPSEIVLAAHDGDVLDATRAIVWREASGRTWPESFEVWHGSRLSWREQVDAIDTATRWIDSFFVPPDRRGIAGTPIGGSRPVDIPPMCVKRLALPQGLAWDAVADRWRREAAELAEKRSLVLESYATVELGPDAGPRALLLRLARAPADPPEGFLLVPERIGVAVSKKGVASVDAALVAELRGHLPDEVEPGAAYVRFEPGKLTGDIVLVIPGG